MHILILVFTTLFWDKSGSPYVLQLLWFLFPIIRIFIISSKLDVSDVSIHLISLLFNDWHIIYSIMVMENGQFPSVLQTLVSHFGKCTSYIPPIYACSFMVIQHRCFKHCLWNLYQFRHPLDLKGIILKHLPLVLLSRAGDTCGRGLKLWKLDIWPKIACRCDVCYIYKSVED